jgi:hypothetical protein
MIIFNALKWVLITGSFTKSLVINLDDIGYFTFYKSKNYGEKLYFIWFNLMPIILKKCS